MGERKQNRKLNVLLIGVTGRPQSMNTALDILENSKHQLSCIIFQKRFSKRITSLRFYLSLVKKFSYNFIKSKIAEWIQIKLKKVTGQSDFHDIVRQGNIEYHEVSDINSQEAISLIKSESPDVIVLSGAPVVKADILKCVRKHTINVHRSLLPKYAGLDAIFWALYHDEEKIGATVHTVNEKIDAGKIIVQREKVIEPGDNLQTLTHWYESKVGELIVEALDLISDPQFIPAEQDFSKRSYFSWPMKQQRKELERKLEERNSKVKKDAQSGVRNLSEGIPKLFKSN